MFLLAMIGDALFAILFILFVNQLLVMLSKLSPAFNVDIVSEYLKQCRIKQKNQRPQFQHKVHVSAL